MGDVDWGQAIVTGVMMDGCLLLGWFAHKWGWFQ